MKILTIDMADEIERLQHQLEAFRQNNRELENQADTLQDACYELQQRVSELEAAILTHVEELGLIPDAETVQWWVENNQPVDIQTVKTTGG